MSSDTYTVVQYYTITVTLAFAGQKTGTIQLYNGNTLLASFASSNSASVVSYTYVGTSVPTFTVRYTVASNNASWHNSYFYNGFYRDSAMVADSSVTFGNGMAQFSFTPTNDSNAVSISIGNKVGLTFNGTVGVASYSAAYSPSHSTGTFAQSGGTVLSPTSISGSNTTEVLYVEYGTNVTVNATASSGYVFSLAGGFVSQTSGINSVNGNGTAAINNGQIVAPTTSGTINVVPSAYAVKVTQPNSSWGTVYVVDDVTGDSSSTSLPLVTGRSYHLGFTSSRADYEAPTVTAWLVGGSSQSSNSFTAPSSAVQDLTVSATLQQNAWPVTVSAGSNGAVSIAGRYLKATGAALSNTGYLYADGSDYIDIAITPNDHYEVSAVVASENLEAYPTGGANCYSLSAQGNATLSYAFALAECVVTTSTNDPTLCDVSPASATFYWNGSESATSWATETAYAVGDWVEHGSTVYRCAIAHTSGTFSDDLSNGKWTPIFLTVYCQLKAEHIGAYRVDYWTVGGVARTDGEAGGQGQFYLVLSPSDVNGRATLVCVPHLVSTYNALTVTKSGDATLGTVYVQVGSDAEESISSSPWSQNVRENTQVRMRAVAAFGGEISAVTPSGISTYDLSESSISFSMPSNAASVNFAISEKDKKTLALCVANSTSPSLAVGKVTLTAPGSASVHEEVDTLAAQSFAVYKNTAYTLTADDSDSTYTFAGWYLNDSTYVSSSLSLSITLSDSAKYTAVYVMRTTGTIGISYGIKSGDDVNPVTLPSTSQPFGLAITTPPDQTGPDRWVVGNSHQIAFSVTPGNSVEEGIAYIWTPVRVEVKADSASETYQTVWTYDELNPESLSGQFIMRDDMLVRLVFVKVQAEGYGRVQALFMDGVTREMGELSVFSTEMRGYYSLGGVAEALCYVGHKAVLAAAPKPGYSFSGWFKIEDGAYVPVESKGAILTVDSVASGGGTYYASFSYTGSTVRAWNAGTSPKTFLWRSKVYVGAQFVLLRNVRIYADAYPVTLTVMTATAPNDVFSEGAHTVSLSISGQKPRMLPALRLEKYFAFSVAGAARINHVALASSMEALK